MNMENKYYNILLLWIYYRTGYITYTMLILVKYVCKIYLLFS